MRDSNVINDEYDEQAFANDQVVNAKNSLQSKLLKTSQSRD